MKYSTLHLTEVAFNSIKANHALPGVALTLDDDVVHLMPWNSILPTPDPDQIDEKYSVIVASTDRCSIAMDGVIDGSKFYTPGTNVSGITTTPVTNWQLVGYTVLLDSGTSNRVNIGNNIVMPSDNIIITPISQVVTGSRKFTMLGFGSTNNFVAIYDPVNLVVTNNYILWEITKLSDDLVLEWGNFNITNSNANLVEGWLDIPRSTVFSKKILNNRVGSGIYGLPIYFVFGISELESTYRPWGFEITESIDDTQQRVRIIQGTPAKIIEHDGNGKTTENAVYGTMTLEYPTNIRCLVVPIS